MGPPSLPFLCLWCRLERVKWTFIHAWLRTEFCCSELMLTTRYSPVRGMYLATKCQITPLGSSFPACICFFPGLTMLAQVANNLVAQMLFLANEDPGKDITLYSKILQIFCVVQSCSYFRASIEIIESRRLKERGRALVQEFLRRPTRMYTTPEKARHGSQSVLT